MLDNIYRGIINPHCEMRAEDTAPENNKMLVSGYALRFNDPTVLFSIGDTDYKEVILPGAFDGCDMVDVIFDRGHAIEDKILARTANGTLTLTVDEIGLRFTAEIANTQEGRDTYELIKRGDIGQCSFAAEIREESYDTEAHLRKIIRFKKLYDVAAVTFPAYNNTEVSVEMRNAFGIGGKPPDKDFEINKQKLLLKF